MAAVGYLVSALLIAALVAFIWSQLSVVLGRRYPRQQPKPEPPQTTTAPEQPAVWIAPGEPKR